MQGLSRVTDFNHRCVCKYPMWRDLGPKRSLIQFLFLLAQMLTSMHTTQILALTSSSEPLYFMSLSDYRMNTDALRMLAVLLELAQ